MQDNVKLLMISFHFPPIAGSSGFLRALKFCRYFKEFGVTPHLLTVSPLAYEQINANNALLSKNLDVTVHRALGFDASRHFAIKGKYFAFLSLPDKWSSWIPFAVVKGLLLNYKVKFDAIWVTYPISSALLVALFLAKCFNKPLFVDLRDPVWEEETWQATRRQKLLSWIERRVLKKAAKIIFTSPGTLEKYRRRYPALIAEKAELLTNGFDNEDFAKLNPSSKSHPKKIFLHSGLIPVYERDPDAFFIALSSLKKQQLIEPEKHEFRLRASGHDGLYQQRVIELGIQDLVSFYPPIGYTLALEEMLAADVLMVFQHDTCNWQIPAKVFEYFKATSPIWAFTDEDSDTANMVRSHSNNCLVAPLSDANLIAKKIEDFINQDNWQAQNTDIEQYSRQHLTKKLAALISATLSS